jgi:hypothetical protein
MIKNIYLRIFVGGNSILIGLLLLLAYFNRNKDNLWGDFYRLGNEINKLSNFRFWGEKMYLIFGWFAVFAGLTALFFGFRKGIGY